LTSIHFLTKTTRTPILIISIVLLHRNFFCDRIIMSNTNIRDMDELEGVLFPVATAAVGSSSQQNSSMTTPLIPNAEAVFDYDTALAREQQQQIQDNSEVILDNAKQLNHAGVSDDSKSTVGRARRTGIIRSEEELESIRRANRRAFSQNYHEKNSIKNANEFAKERDRQGLQMKSNNNQVEEHKRMLSETKTPPLKIEKEQPPETYEMKEYDCGNYETRSYEVEEYKSVYD